MYFFAKKEELNQTIAKGRMLRKKSKLHGQVEWI